MNGYKFPLYFALAQRLRKEGELTDSPNGNQPADRLTIHEISHAVDHYREKRGNRRDCTLRNLYIPNRNPTGKETVFIPGLGLMPSDNQIILIKQ
jgi:hypothetical protein